MYRYRRNFTNCKGFKIFNPVITDDVVAQMDQLRKRKKLTIISIDIGEKNFATRVETRSKENSHKFSNSPLFETSLFLREDISNGDDEGLSPETLHYLCNFIDDIVNDENIPLIDLVVIERQMSENITAMKIYQHVLSHFIFLIRNNMVKKDLILSDIHPISKYSQLSCPTNLNRQAKKKWGTEKSREILDQGNDEWSLKVMQDRKGVKRKLDDLGDTIIQIQAILKMLDL